MIGIGGSSVEMELAAIQPMAHLANPIPQKEYQERIDKACKLMQDQKIAALYLNAGTNLLYFTGTRWRSSERMVGALLFPDGKLCYIAPAFEKGTILNFIEVDGEIHCWEEHECPYRLLHSILLNNGVTEGMISMDETTPFFITSGLQAKLLSYKLETSKSITASCRMIKSEAELAIMQVAMNITLEVQKATARILRTGISSQEVVDFIDEAHKRFGVSSGSYFCIVLFGVDSSFPHGVKQPKDLEWGETVLIDTGCMLYDYISDITRTYSFGEVGELQRNIWNIEKETQLAAFNQAQLGNTCGSVDIAARKVLESHHLGPDYQLPGLPHRTGHGIGMDIHEWPYIVRNDDTILEPGICFSIEPMICIPNEFGIRHEDHVYMTKDGPKWFTEPSFSIDDPFGLAR